PLVDAACSLEEQALGVDRQPDLRVLRLLVDLEVEAPPRPREERIDRLLDLDADVALELLAGDPPQLDEPFAELLVGVLRLATHRLGELIVADHAVAHQEVAQTVGTVDDRRVRDATALEEDLAELRSVGHREAARLLAHGQELTDVGQARFLQTSLD